jgi:hypothetical protein
MLHCVSSLVQRTALLCATAVPLALLSGCSMTSTATPDNSLDSSAGISGIVHGGRQPIVDATVTLWAAGNAGYGSAATALGTTTTDSNGNFSFHTGTGATYSCPSVSSSTESQYIYITSSGGQPTPSVTNTSAALMLALGNCSTVLAANPSVVVNEVTTVASMFALQQFFSPSGSGMGNFGTSATNTTGLANAFATVNNLIAASSGTANLSSTATGTVAGYATNPVVTITPEYMKINTMANALAACVNTNGGAPCPTLFSDVNSTAALDTLQAAYYLAKNPTSTVSGTSNITAIFNLAVANSPFQTSLSVAPTDWTVGVTYGSESSQTVAATAVYLLTEPEYVAIDSNDNLWFASFKTTSLTTAGNSVTELSALGVPLNQVMTAVGNIAGPRNLVIDPSNNVWVGSYGTTANSFGKQLTEYTASGGLTNIFTIGSGEDGLASDTAGNIFIATSSGTGGSADLEYLPAGSSNGTSSTQLATAISAGTYSSLAIDSYHDLWLSNNASTATTQFICSLTGTPSCSGTTTAAGGQTGSQSVSIDHSNNIWVGNYSTTAGNVSVIAATNNSTITSTVGPYSGGGMLNPTRSITDGLGNYWVTNYASNAGSVSELTSAGVPISPSATTTPAFVGGFAHTYAGVEGIAIDASGNVWIGNGGSNAAASATNYGFFTEIVGAAAPVTNPLAKNLPVTAGGANTLGTRP